MSEPIAPSAPRRHVRAVYYFAALLLALVVVGVGWYRSGSPRATLTAGDPVNSVAFSPDGKVLAAGSYRYDYNRHQPEGIIILWDVSTHRRTASWVAHRDFITSLAFDPDGRTLTSAAIARENGNTNSEVKMWDVSTYGQVGDTKTVKSAKHFPITSLDGRVIARHAGGGTVVLADAAGGELFRLQADPHQLNCAAFSPDGRILATGGGDTRGGGPSPIPGKNGDLRLWDVGTGRLLIRHNRHWWGPIQAVTFSPDGKLVASASLDGSLKLWDVPGP
jgi:WD40 repeat protein